MRISLPLLILALATLPLGASAQCMDDVCPDNDAGPPDRPDDCWNDDVGGDICNQVPPEPCVPTEPNFEFIDDRDDDAGDNQVYAFNTDANKVGCGTLRVDKTGYYQIFDIELSESGPAQKDETGYLKISNSCNSDGWAIERNYEDRFLILDVDNDACTDDPACGAGRSCGAAGGCIPDAPTFMGTFLLVEGEDNVMCLNHWCPEYDDIVAGGGAPGFVYNGCGAPGAINSIHFKVADGAIACEEETTLYPCTFGCFEGECQADPCDDSDCPLYCKDGACSDEDPCADLNCEYGCKNGYCLQEPDSRGVDGDGDGYNEYGDCDDDDPLVNPGATEVCGNNVDDDCDGAIDEADCDDGSGGGGGGAGDEGGSDGCGCSASSTPGLGMLLLAALAMLALLGLTRRRRGPRQVERDRGPAHVRKTRR